MHHLQTSGHVYEEPRFIFNIAAATAAAAAAADREKWKGEGGEQGGTAGGGEGSGREQFHVSSLQLPATSPGSGSSSRVVSPPPLSPLSPGPVESTDIEDVVSG